MTLAFNNSGVSTNSFGGVSGHFTMGADASGNPTLTVNKNLVKINSGDSFNIEARTSLSLENTNINLKAMYPVYIAKGVVSSKRVNILLLQIRICSLSQRRAVAVPSKQR